MFVVQHQLHAHIADVQAEEDTAAVIGGKAVEQEFGRRFEHGNRPCLPHVVCQHAFQLGPVNVLRRRANLCEDLQRIVVIALDLVTELGKLEPFHVIEHVEDHEPELEQVFLDRI